MHNYLFILLVALRASALTDETYVAGVVEYFPVRKQDASIKETLDANVDEYVRLLGSVTQSLDIIVFPEQTLCYGSNLTSRTNLLTATTLVPSADEHVSPCDLQDQSYEDFFAKLSCAAKARNVYLSVNILERQKCEGNDCANDNWNIYNTNVVFDRKGYIVARYRKYNLHDERNINITSIPEQVTFTTDFGVTFSMFICFDILFDEPALKLVEQGVKHFIYPAKWFSELHWLTAIQAQQMWSYANDVVLLASGANDPKIASGGSGIYQGRRGSLETYISDKEGSKVLVQHVQKHWNPKHPIIREPNVNTMKNFHFWQENYNNYTSILANETKLYEMCVQDVCCYYKLQFKVHDEYAEHYKYRYIGYSGLRSFARKIFRAIDVCGIIVCLNESLSSCGERFPIGVNGIIFEEISVSLRIPKTTKAVHYPNSLLSNYEPLHTDSFTWDIDLSDERYATKTIKLIKPTKDIFAFGIYGRFYGAD